MNVKQLVRRRGGAPLLLLSLLLGILAAPPATLASDGGFKLALSPVGQAGAYFDLTMRPGEIARLQVDISNDGTASVGARTYATDVFTIINGGYGGRLRDTPQTGMTAWLEYATTVLDLQPGQRARRSLTVTVPVDIGPGEYMSSLIVENDAPVRGEGGVAFDQFVRQAVAVAVTVPGVRTPALRIGEASHQVVAGKSIVSVAVENSGNVRLKPLVEFTLRDATGAQVSRASLQMDTFYARTDTFVAVSLAALLLPGTYTVQISLDDQTQHVRVGAESITFVVVAAATSATPDGAVPRLTEVIQGGGIGDSPFPAMAAIGGTMLLGLVCLALLARRRRRDLAG
jgi:hypothetical protein